MIKLLLRFFDLLAPLIRLMGGNYAQFRAILETKLILDTRRRGLANQSSLSQQKSGRQQKNTFAATLMFYVFIGLTLIGTITMAPPLVGMTLVHSYIMLMITMALIVDFSSVLLDTTDNAILQPRPVDGRTVLLARVAHIVTYLTLLSLSLSTVVLIVGAIRFGPWFVPVFLGTLCCSIVLVVSATNVLYLLAMRLTTAEKMRDIITYLQIAMMILLVGSSQLLPRVVQTADFRFLDISHSAWIYFYPPTWMAGPIDMLAGHRDQPQVTLTILALLVPVVALLFVLTFVAPRFNRLLLDVDASPASEKPRPVAAGTKPKGSSIAGSLAATVTRSSAERSTFELVWHLCSRDRQFKMRTYPTLVLPFMMSAGFIFSGRSNWLEALRTLPTTSKHLLLLYIASAMIPGILLQLRFSDKAEAAWMYFSLPIAQPGEVMLGALKAIMMRFIVPGFMLVAAVVLCFWGWHSILDVGVAFCALLFISAMEAVLLARTLPFSQSFGTLDMSGRFARSFLMMVVPAVLGLGHFGLTFMPGLLQFSRLGVAIAWLTLACWGILLLGGSWLIARRYRNTTWAMLRLAEA